MSMIPPLDAHPLLRALRAMAAELDDVAELDPTFMPTADKAPALVEVERELNRLEGLRLELLAASSDVAIDEGARSAGVWLAAETLHDPSSGVRDQRMADELVRRPAVSAALRSGVINAVQSRVIVTALGALPTDLDPELAAKAEAQLLADAGHFGPRELRVLGRRVLEVIAPDVAEAREEALLLAEESRANAETRLVFRPRGAGITDVMARLPEHVADRLRVYLDSMTAPRRAHRDFTPLAGDVDQLPLPRRRGQAFCALLENVPADRLPAHGGTGTSVVVTLDHHTLTTGLGVAELSTGGRITAAEARRLACQASILPAVLGGAGEVLDLGRSRRLFSPAQRKAMAIRDRRCRAEGCDIQAAWCEAHHAADPWSHGGRTDLADGVLLCSFHHHRAHDRRWHADRLSNGDVRYRRRT